MRAAGYCRVSSVDQIAGGSLDSQEQAIRAECERRGWPAPLIVREQASTRRLQPARESLVNRVVLGEFDALIVARLDRFGRSTTDILENVERIEKAGRNIIFLSPAIGDSSDPYGRVQLAMFSALARLERDLIGLRTREGIAAKKAAGTYRGSQRPQCESYDDETIDAVLRWHGRGHTHGEVAAMMERQGFEPIRAEAWNAQIVAAIVRERCGTCERCRLFKRQRAGQRGPAVPAEPESASSRPVPGPDWRRARP